MKIGDRIKIPDGYGGYIDKVLVVEEFRHCLGVFENSDYRKAGIFTPLCDLYEPGPESEQKYLSNFGEYFTNEVQAWIDVP